MRRLCLAVLFCVMFVSGARADRKGVFIRLECNQDFGLFDIEKYSIPGAKIGDFFERDFLTYEYDINKESKIKTNVVILNVYRLREPYYYHCQLAPHQELEAAIKWNTAESDNFSEVFFVSVSEQRRNLEHGTVTKKVLLDEVLLGAGGPVDKISIAATDDNLGTDIHFFENGYFSYILSAEKEAPITQEIIKKHEIPIINENDGYCEKHACGVDIEDMPSLEKLSEVLQEVLAENAAKKAKDEEETEAENNNRFKIEK